MPCNQKKHFSLFTTFSHIKSTVLYLSNNLWSNFWYKVQLNPKWISLPTLEWMLPDVRLFFILFSKSCEFNFTSFILCRFYHSLFAVTPAASSQYKIKNLGLEEFIKESTVHKTFRVVSQGTFDSMTNTVQRDRLNVATWMPKCWKSGLRRVSASDVDAWKKNFPPLWRVQRCRRVFNYFFFFPSYRLWEWAQFAGQSTGVALHLPRLSPFFFSFLKLCDVTPPQLPFKGRCVAHSPAPNIWCHKSNSAGQSVGAVVFSLPIKLGSLFFQSRNRWNDFKLFFFLPFFLFGG